MTRLSNIARITVATLVLGVLAALLPAPGQPAAAAPGLIRVLIIDGISNHDWQRTTTLVRGILKPTNLFDVSVFTAPVKLDDATYNTWCPDFSKYDVVLMNYNNNGQKVTWNPTVRAAFEQFVQNGGGAFILHSANNAFPDWDAYNHIIGLGWRKKEYGTAIQIAPDESLIRIPPGQGGGSSHQPRQDRLIHRLGDDPIHAGMPRTWMTPLIEVYNYTRGPAENMTVESWAEDPKTQVHWPIEWTVSYGKGRVYCSSFGHVWRNDPKDPDAVDFRCADFQTIMVRALQWLAQRPVTYPIPSDFPSATATSLRALPTFP